MPHHIYNSFLPCSHLALLFYSLLSSLSIVPCCAIPPYCSMPCSHRSSMCCALFLYLLTVSCNAPNPLQYFMQCSNPSSLFHILLSSLSHCSILCFNLSSLFHALLQSLHNVSLFTIPISHHCSTPCSHLSSLFHALLQSRPIVSCPASMYLFTVPCPPPISHHCAMPSSHLSPLFHTEKLFFPSAMRFHHSH